MKSPAQLLVPAGVFVGVVLLIAAVIVGQVGGFFFTLDDPYIHLSVAENLLNHGVYGINPAEAASPSSSILWPFLLVPLEALGVGPPGTFLLNQLLGALAVLLATRIIIENADGWTAVPLAIAWFFGCNLVGLVFTGMEHVAQVGIVVAIAHGALRTLSDGEPPRWLWLVLVVAPLIRYENMAVSVPVILWLFGEGRRRGAIATFAAIGVAVGSFSLVLWLNGMWLLPSSVVAKSTHIKDNGIWAPLANFLFNVMEWAGGAVLILAMVLVGFALVRRTASDPPTFDSRARLALAAAATGFLHLAFGRNGWFHRYEAYAVAYTTLMVLALLPQRWVRRTAAGASVAMLAIGWQYCLTLRQIPTAAENISAQQYQLHRLALELGAPVGVNDLGWVSYRNDQYVYDFYGLGNYDATEHRLAGDGTDWMEAAAIAANLELVMIATVWFNDDVPKSWTPVGSLCVDMPRVTLKDAEVRFFAVKPPTDDLRAHIAEWARGLPPTTHYSEGRCTK